MIRRHARRVFVMTETALAVVVVVGAGLLLQTVHHLKAVDAGFDRSRLLTFSITLRRVLPPPRPGPRIPMPRGLRGVPGVRMATA